jgi:hypothetical protein
MVMAASRMVDILKGLIGDDAGATLVLDGRTRTKRKPKKGREKPFQLRRDDPFRGLTPPDPDAFVHAWGYGVGPITQKLKRYATSAGQRFGGKRPAPGRKLVKGAPESAPWMYIDTWYILGPFPNPGRRNMLTKFPPEQALETGAEIDLDAVYMGMDGMTLTWNYRKSAEVCVAPHIPVDYGIWYAYTEIYSEGEAARWCIFGSDDFGRAWINGDLVYESPEQPHPWIPDRGYRKVVFRKGFNSVLFKLENAWGRTGFSVCVFVGDPRATWFQAVDVQKELREQEEDRKRREEEGTIMYYPR